MESLATKGAAPVSSGQFMPPHAPRDRCPQEYPHRTHDTQLCLTVTIYPENCYKNFDLLEWDLKRFGPYVVCKEGTVRFRWKGMHGVFQIPSIACPSNFTSGETDTYKFLAPVSNGGGFDWKVPEEPGHYWITSQHPDDCRNGMIAEVFVVNGDEEPFPASYAVRASRWSSLFVAAVSSLIAVWMHS